MAGRWYFRLGSSEHGPVTLDYLITRVQAGQITKSHWVREGESDPWENAGQTPELRPYFVTANRPSVEAIPVARPVAAAAPAPPPVSPQGAALPSFDTVTVARTAKPSAAATGNRPERRQAKTPLGLIVGIAVGGLALLGIGGFVAASLLLTSEAATPVTAKANDNEDHVVRKKPALSLAAEREKGAASIAKWREAGLAKGGLKNVFSFEVEQVRWQTSPEVRCLVELSITNTSPDNLHFAGWNSAGKQGAWLVDRDLDFVAAAEGQAAKQQIAPGESIVEVLEFSTGKKNFKELRLVLPYAAVARAGHWGYSISGDKLRGEAKPRPQAALAATAPPKPAAAKQPAPSKTVEKAAARASDDDMPQESLKDLIRKSKARESAAADEKQTK